MLSEAQKAQFDTQGYLLVKDVLNPTVALDPIIDEYATLLDQLVDDLFARSEISQAFAGLEFRERMTKVYAETKHTYAQYFNLSLPMVDVTEQTPFWTGPAVFNLIKTPALLDVVEAIIGPEIASNPIQHVRIKPPQKILPEDQLASGLVGTTPWHQDAAVIPPDAGTEMVTVWVPINDAPVETGCLQFLKGAHKSGLRRHALGRVDGLALPMDNTDEQAVDIVPAKRGDILLIHRHCPHASLPNVSELLRFSLDLRFHPADQTSGRDFMPSFVARSKANPSQELSDPEAWTEMWRAARTWLATSPEAPKSNYHWLQ